MKTTALKLYTGFAKTKLALFLCAGLIYGAVVLLSGGSAFEMLRFYAVFALYVLLPGKVLAAGLFQRNVPAALVAPMAGVCGSALLAGCALLAGLLNFPLLPYAVPLLVGAAGLAARWRALKTQGPRPRWQPSPAGGVLAVLFAALLVVLAFEGAAHFALPSPAAPVLPSQDLLFNAGNAASFTLGVPPQDIRFVGVPLRYHYFTELVAGALAKISGVPCYNVLAFYLPPITLAAVLLCLYRCGLVVYQNSTGKSLLFAASFFLLGCATLWNVFRTGTSIYWNLNAQHLITNINAQATATVFLAVFYALFTHGGRANWRLGPGFYVATVLTFLLLCVSKGPISAIVICAVAAAVLVGLFRRGSTWRPLALLAGLLLVFVAVYRYMYSGGAGSSVQLNPTGTLSLGPLWGLVMPLVNGPPGRYVAGLVGVMLLQTFLTLPAQFPLWLYAAVGDARRLFKLEPHRLLAQAGALGGVVAYYLFSNAGMSQMYFLFTAMFFINLLAVDAAASVKKQFVRKKSPARGVAVGAFGVLCGVCLGVGLLSAGCATGYMGGSGARQLLRHVAWYPQREFKHHPATADDAAAAAWMRKNMPQSAVFATNRVYESFVSQFFSGMGERQSFMEGYHYTKTNMGVDDSLIAARWQVLVALFGGGTLTEGIAPLARENGISYLVYVDVNNDIGRGEVQFGALEKVFESPTVRIYRVPAA